MPSIDDVYSGNTLKASDIKGHIVTAIIESVVPKVFDQRDGSKKTKLVLEFVGKNKALVLNSTNARMIAQTHGVDYSLWTGKKIRLGTHMTPMGEGICVIPEQPQDRIESGPRRSMKDTIPDQDMNDEVPW